jgi:hypothetical protein
LTGRFRLGDASNFTSRLSNSFLFFGTYLSLRRRWPGARPEQLVLLGRRLHSDNLLLFFRANFGHWSRRGASRRNGPSNTFSSSLM